ncbi:hypothetical protein LCM10_03600 [Rossellomorea aquimaris]|uniref:hypothetical protein n=1 Tax=Rossellomorea aquimaris TaxID=189382 RepID=UPI001CD60CF9|nr:hypothetical protein [Rossellomorea aquimaris]MCA1054061.1 hypothetical protein [Rossellomorea aquimaris]
MNPDHQEKKQKLRKVQALYRSRRYKHRAQRSPRAWTVVVGVSMLILFFFFIMSVLFDLGIEVPSFFGR